MRVFLEPNTKDGFVCPICKTGDIKPVVLVGLFDTIKDDMVEVRQVHIECLDLYFVTDEKTGKTGIVHLGEI